MSRALMGIIAMIRGNPFDRLSVDRLTNEKIRLERRERLIIGEIRSIADKQKEAIQAGYGKDISEQRVLARQIDQIDKQLKLKNIQLGRISDQAKVVDNFTFVTENRTFLDESGLMKVLSEIPKSKLEDFLSQINLRDSIQQENVSDVLRKMEDEFGLVGDIEDDASTRALMELWGTEAPPSATESYDLWQQKRDSEETVTGA